MVHFGQPAEGQRIELGHFPTPVRPLSGLVSAEGELWLKDDGHSSYLYGGNKVRKLERSLKSAMDRGCERVVTMGAAGSHHVLATSIFGRQLGLKVAAVLCPQPWTEHAETTLQLALDQGAELHPAKDRAALPLALARELRRDDYILPPGGSDVHGTLGYVDAMRELSTQIQAGELPRPDVIVAALGSGGTVGGMLAGSIELKLEVPILGVAVATGALTAYALAVGLARAALRSLRRRPRLSELSRLISVDATQLGRGYGWPSRPGQVAIEMARGVGLELDPTYTAKAFASALAVAGSSVVRARPVSGMEFPFFKLTRGINSIVVPSGRPLRVLYWHTFSAVSPQSLRGEGSLTPLPACLRALLPRD